MKCKLMAYILEEKNVLILKDYAMLDRKFNALTKHINELSN
ncbi:hypothetical protein ACQKII_08465 [Lysinibacillus sp. NPDC048646]